MIDMKELTRSGAQTLREGRAPLSPRPRREEVVSSSDAEAGPWEPFPEEEGVRMRVLWRNPVSGSFSGLLEVAPGAHLRPHFHLNAVHHLFVVAGTCELAVSERVIGPGSYIYVPAEEVHGIEAVDWESCRLFFLHLEGNGHG
jgi:quercetin dioxygenase-like cupin family protein